MSWVGVKGGGGTAGLARYMSDPGSVAGVTAWIEETFW